jgi:zinc protease
VTRKCTHKAWAAALVLAATSAHGLMIDSSHRSQIAGIDLITFRTNVRDVVSVLGALPAGDAMAESGNIAIPTLAGMMLDRGTKTLDKFAIAEKLDSVGAERSYAVGAQSLEVRAKCLKKDLPLVLSLVAAELRDPALSADEFAKAKQQFIGSLQQSLQNTASRAQEAFGRALFPDGHPNHPHSIDEYLAAAKTATLEEVKAFHAKYYGPKAFTLILAGDVGAEEAAQEIGKDFSGWSGGQDYLRPASPARPSGPREISVPISQKPSTSIILGQVTGLRYRDPDALALRVGTAILGQGFTGRLMGTVRDREGLTYQIGAGMAEDSIADGEWMISASFAPALLDKGIASTRRVLDQWWQEGVTDAELGARKKGLVGNYEVGLSTSAGLAGAILVSIQRGYDVSWLDGYPEAIKALTREQVNRAIHTRLDPRTMVLVEAGSLAAAAAPTPAR